MQMNNWNISEFNKLAKDRLPPSILELIDPSIRSIPWKFFLCRYHIDEYHRVLKEQLNGDPNSQLVQALGKILNQAARTDEGKEFMESCFIAEAHLIAFAQALHSTADILAHIIYYCFNLEPYFTPREKIYLSTVYKKLKENYISPEMTNLISLFLESDEFNYLMAYVNITKHQSIVSSNYFVDLASVEGQHGLRLREFTYI